MLYRENGKYIKREDFIRLGECSVRLNNEQFVPTEFMDLLLDVIREKGGVLEYRRLYRMLLRS